MNPRVAGRGCDNSIIQRRSAARLHRGSSRVTALFIARCEHLFEDQQVAGELVDQNRVGGSIPQVERAVVGISFRLFRLPKLLRYHVARHSECYAALIREFGGLEPLLNNIDKVKSVRTREKLANAREQILQNRKMVDLDCEMDLPVPIDDLRIEPDYPALIAALEKCEFKSLLQEVRDEAAKVGTVVQANLL